MIARVALSDLAEIAWQEGRLDDARKYWEGVFAGPGDERRSRRLERVAACAWDSGAYLRALATALVAVRAARRAADPEALALCLELQARILVHMSRLPDLRWMVTARQKARVAAQLRTLVTSNTFGSGVRPRFLDAAELLVSDPEARSARRPGAATKPQAAAMWSESFVQYESLSGTLDFRRGEMRRAVATGTEVMTREWLGNYQHGARFLGKSAALHTAPLLPGAAPFFGWSEGARLLLLRSRATPWHRVRMVALFTTRRLRPACLTEIQRWDQLLRHVDSLIRRRGRPMGRGGG
ncbi:hypothetical protein [Microbacterium sp.]|uniref:hypothetical protein n=1 Tax=Microbacterium sp. TaxID=51671 RepID=UPI002734D7E3|nr:hypothetical protein [Microbacterium sp.]MDP3952947.1 hypothetical protein [Microbacterium sp.]